MLASILSMSLNKTNITWFFFRFISTHFSLHINSTSFCVHFLEYRSEGVVAVCQMVLSVTAVFTYFWTPITTLFPLISVIFFLLTGFLIIFSIFFFWAASPYWILLIHLNLINKFSEFTNFLKFEIQILKWRLLLYLYLPGKGLLIIRFSKIILY